MRLIRRALKVFVACALGTVLVIGTLIGSLWLEHRRETTLPIPTGSFAVGRTTDVWVDESRTDTVAPAPRTKRELVVWIWYPSTAGRQTVIEDYLPGPLREAIDRARGPLIRDLLTRDLSTVRAHSARYADLSTREPSFPVIIMRAGASAEVANYSRWRKTSPVTATSWWDSTPRIARTSLSFLMAA
jgi:hypothetical protein